jgi:phosphoribosylformylglycinamidine synthase
MSLDDYKAWAQVKPLEDVPESTNIAADLLKLMGSPNLASRRWIWEQYDQSVGADTVQRPGGDAAVVRVHGSRKALAITTDCTPRYAYADPYEGGKQAIAEAYRNLCAVGARPLAVTNCLNFGNPQRPEIMAQFVEALRGMGDACRALDFPIVSGNVSLYNESKATGGGSAILPTPAIGGVGLLEDWEKSATIGFKRGAQSVWIIGGDWNGPSGSKHGHLGQSVWLREVGGSARGAAPTVDLKTERATADFIRALVNDGRVTAVHDISDGGLLVALAEMALAGNIGLRLDLPDLDRDGLAAWCFGEDQGRYVVTTDYDSNFNLLEAAIDSKIRAWSIGITSASDGIRLVRQGNLAEAPDISLADLRAAHEGFFPGLMGADAALA